MITSTISFSQRDVILIPFPSTDFSTLKQRPALIISSNAFNDAHNDVIVMAITSQVPRDVPNEEYLLTPQDIEMSGLPKPSVIKIGKIVTVNKMLVQRKLGNLPAATVEEIKAKLQSIL